MNKSKNDESTWLQNLKQSKLYPVYFLLRSPLLIPRLVSNEGIGGAIRWLSTRFYLLVARVFDRSNDFYERPINPFHSRLGFSLVRRVEFLVYDEIFLDYCYAFDGFSELIKQSLPLRILDFGTHHGFFMNYVRMLNPKAEIYGAEMNPESFTVAGQRFSGQSGIHINNVAIGGSQRRLKVGTCSVSVEQSIYMEQKDGGFEVELITPMEFIRRQKLQAEDISVLKMDIEGAESEVFANFDSVQPLLAVVKAFLIEIHPGVDVGQIKARCEGAGLKLVEQRGINYYFRR
jgi:FkbM family methyltransferase